MSTIETRRAQMFPKLSAEEIERLRRFGTVRHYAPGELLITTGEISPGMSVIVQGKVAVMQRDPLGHLAPILEEGPGDFLAEVGQLSGGPALVDAKALTDVTTLLIPADRLRNVLIAEAELGEKITRALILRRVALIETGAGGPVMIGPADSPDVIRLQGFLTRNAFPHQLLDPADRSRGRRADRSLCGRRWRTAARRFVRTARSCGIPARSNSRAASAWCTPTTAIRPTTWRSSAPDRPDLRPPSMPRPKDCR